jgi:hypothetical protein
MYVQAADFYALIGKYPPLMLTYTQLVMDLLLRSSLHGVVMLVVLGSPGIWSSPVYYLLASNGMLYVNWVNFQDMRTSEHIAWFGKMFVGLNA